MTHLDIEKWTEAKPVSTEKGVLFASCVGEARLPDQSADAPFLFRRFKDQRDSDNIIVNDADASMADSIPLPPGCTRRGYDLVGYGESTK